MPSKSVLIAGYFGYKNTGDEAILGTIIRDLHALQPDVNITVVSGDSKDTEKNHGVRAVLWNDIQAIISAARDCDKIILGGGGIFHDYWGVRRESILTKHHAGIPFYSSFPLLASLLGKPLMIYGVGIGPLITEEGKNLTRMSFDAATLASVRDKESLHLLQSLGISNGNIAVTADPTFNLLVDNQAAKNILKQLGINSGTALIGVCVRNWEINVDAEKWQTEIASGLDNYLDNNEAAIIFIPFQTLNHEDIEDDVSAANNIIARMNNKTAVKILPGRQSPEVIAGILGRCDLVVGMRYHSILLAASAGVPVIGIAYDGKVANLFAQLKMESYVIDLEALTEKSLIEKMSLARKNREQIKQNLSMTVDSLRKRANKNTRLLAKLLDSKYSKKQQPKKIDQFINQFALEQTWLLAEKDQEAQILAAQVDEKEKNLRSQAVKLDKTQQEAHELKLQLKSMEQANQSKQKRLEEITALFDNEKQLVRSLSTQMEEIYNSRGWKLLWWLWQVRLFLAPKGSSRERAVGWISKILQFVRRLVHQPYLYLKRLVIQITQENTPRMSRHAYAFDRYKRRRDHMYSSNLHSLRLPNQKDLVSIILPVHNGADYIQEAVESILSQTYNNFELIVVDDGSTDKTLEILEPYAQNDARMRIIRQENKKLPAALNRGFQEATGEFLTWTSHDNRLMPDCIQKMVNCLEKNPSWDMVYANMNIIGADGALLKKVAWFAGYQFPPGRGHVYLPRDTSELNTLSNNFIGGAFLYRDRVQFLLGDYNTAQFTREDYEYWMRVNSLLTLKHVDFNDRIYEYRFHSASLTMQDDALRITQDRDQMMVFDNFRRDYYLSPTVWIIDHDENSQRVKETVNLLQSLISRSGQVIFAPHNDDRILPNMWLPCIYIKVTQDAHAQPNVPDRLPISTQKVLLCISDRFLPKDVADGWDTCMAIQAETSQPPILKDQRGWLVSDDIKALITAIDIRTRETQLRLIEESISAPQENPDINISVIVCTYARSEQGLANTLRSVAKQTLKKKNYEVLVVDNNPDNAGTQAVVDKLRAEEFTDYPNHIRITHCPILGLSHARNAGLSQARGEILLFLDDDATVEADILERYRRAFLEHPEAGVIGGHIRVNMPGTTSIPWKDGWERYWSQFLTGYSDYTQVGEWWEFPWGANWCVRKKTLMQVGGFRVRFGRRGSDYYGGEEIIAASLAQKLGYTIGVLPQVEVIHHIEPDRVTLQHVRKTIRANVFAHYQAQIELYLPINSSIKINFKQYIDIIRKLITFLMHPRDISHQASLLESYYYLSAHWELFYKHKVRYALKRFRRPLTQTL